ncbi:MAG: heavy metal sensor histidine kinase [Ideonella sp.]|nr:heavy metal sensor histidine kinase [Ideonella sp.]MCC7458581.1 heavy metal sensor histidine kinase [Nitrospira sp.]
MSSLPDSASLRPQPVAASPLSAERTCSYSIGRRLSLKLALLTMLVLGVTFACLWSAVGMLLKDKNAQELDYRASVMAKLLTATAASGDEAALRDKIESYAALRGGTRLELKRADGQYVFRDPDFGSHAMSEHALTSAFTIDAPHITGGRLIATLSIDFAEDAKLGHRWAAVLVAATLASGALVALAAWWRVRRELRPLHALAQQTRAISPRALDQRLHLDDPAEELLPWIVQFNALMARLELAYAQLEGFNADVAHELRTPLANLIGATELALARERPAAELRDTLVSNLEELQRLATMVNDMLFLSLADRGAVARRGAPVSLAALAEQVVEFHEAAIDEARLDVRIEGDSRIAVDEALFKRAVSNLLGNATRYAEPGSRVAVQIVAEATDAAGHVRVVVQNQGPQIDAQHLPRLFDRFYRGQECRSCDDGQPHHGLGLAIVAAIARMHAGAPLAECVAGTTRIGFTVAAA